MTRAAVLNNVDTIQHCSGALKRGSSDGKDDFRNQMFGELKNILYAIHCVFQCCAENMLYHYENCNIKKTQTDPFTLIKQCKCKYSIKLDVLCCFTGELLLMGWT